LVRILSLDEESFGREWCLDRASLLDAYRATQRAALLEVRSADRHSALGFILVGRTGTAGFIQRLAVHPSVRRSGLASILLAAGTQWLFGHGARIMAVNTEDTNVAALGLYERHGFQPMPYGLFVMERELD
jgi:ribosomal protein S18 acetylase RimI-like enzyme